METYYNGGCYAIKSVPIQYGEEENKVIRSCSGCFNIHAFDDWCVSWMSNKNCQEKIDLDLSDEEFEEIQQWTDERYKFGTNVLPDLKTAIEFKELFFKTRNDIEIYSVYFSEFDANLLISQFAEREIIKSFKGDFPEIELRKNLQKKIKEVNNPIEEFIGYDFIGVEPSSGSFHTFYCHYLANTLIEKFSLRLNEFGLFEEVEEPNMIRTYLNSPSAPVEPVPWYIVKVKLVNKTVGT
jgi:hypothetical protein